MAMLQLYPDSLPDYPRDFGPLEDLGFKVIPYIGVTWMSGTDFSSLADIWVVVSIVIFLLVSVFVLDYPQLMLRRWLLIMGLMFLMRGITVVSTRYPR